MDSKQEIPEDLRNRHEEMVMQATSNFPPEMSGIGPEEAATLIERIASLEAALKSRNAEYVDLLRRTADKNTAILNVQSQLTSAREQIEAARKELWLGHGHVGMYGDDGEMQCGACGILWDYKRNPLHELIHSVLAQKEAQLAAVTGKVTDGNE